MRLPLAPFPGLTIEGTAFDDAFDVKSVCWLEESGDVIATASADAQNPEVLLAAGWIRVS